MDAIYTLVIAFLFLSIYDEALKNHFLLPLVKYCKTRQISHGICILLFNETGRFRSPPFNIPANDIGSLLWYGAVTN